MCSPTIYFDPNGLRNHFICVLLSHFRCSEEGSVVLVLSHTQFCTYPEPRTANYRFSTIDDACDRPRLRSRYQTKNLGGKLSANIQYNSHISHFLEGFYRRIPIFVPSGALSFASGMRVTIWYQKNGGYFYCVVLGLLVYVTISTPYGRPFMSSRPSRSMTLHVNRSPLKCPTGPARYKASEFSGLFEYSNSDGDRHL